MTTETTLAWIAAAETLSHRYFTTPIYYASGAPHIGHMYANVALSLFANHHFLRGRDTLRLTGLDEHGEKIEETARKEGKPPQKLVDDYAVSWKETFALFGLSYDVFMRTTSHEHKENVRRILQICHENGDIYYGEHEGRYCVACEAFLTPKEMNEQFVCLVHKKLTELRKEGNYYFRTSKYVPEIARRIRAGDLLVQERYVNEVLSLCEALEGDLSISRPKSRTEWGIELPFDTSHVAYVWFDALPNYVTGVGGVEAARTNPFWNGCTHIIGKDIIKFHAVYWPAMLLSMGLPLPRLMITGWILAGGHKMSKSLGNVIAPHDLLPYGRDAFVNYAMRAVDVGEDLDLSFRTYLERYNADLANGLGNLASRTLAMVQKYFAGALPALDEKALTSEELALAARAKALPAEVGRHFELFEQAKALGAIWELIGLADKLITDSKPWDLAKAGSPDAMARLSNVLGVALAALRYVGYLAWPYFPEKMTELLASIGEDTGSMRGAWARLEGFYAIKAGHVVVEVPKLFQRVDVTAELAKIEAARGGEAGAKEAGAIRESKVGKDTLKPAKDSAPATAGGVPVTIGIDDFTKVDVRVGTVISADVVEGSDKLLRLQVSLGELGFRQVFSGIRQWVKPEEIVNRNVLVVVNLAPRKMKFGMSEGMVLSTDTQDGNVSPVYVSDTLKEGARLS